jgi:Glycosyl transferases group 1/Glycosyltransferase Family 4
MSCTRVLLISCYFPPTGGVQVLRALSLARYLPECGIDLHVLTTKNPSVPTFDYGLMQQIPETVTVHRSLTLEPPFHLRKRIWSRLKGSAIGAAKAARPQAPGLLGNTKRSLGNVVARALCPDPQVLWYPTAIREAKRIVRQHAIEAVVVTAPPFSAFLIGNELKRRFPHLNLISDIRDEWITYFAKTFAFAGNDYVMLKANAIERATVELSDCVVPVTNASRDEIRSRYPEQPATKFRVVANGFDPASFTGFQSRPHGTGKVVITYTGTIYEPASPKIFLDALDKLPEEVRARFQVRFIGRMAEEFDQSVFANRNTDVRVMGFVPQKEAFRYLEESDYLLLPWADPLNVPGKLYEYVATRKPIIALTRPDADVVKVIRSTQTGWCIDRAETGLLHAFLMQISGIGPRPELVPNEGVIRRYERPALAREYAKVIHECVAARSGARPAGEAVVSAAV